MSDDTSGTPLVPHITSEFLLWLWWYSEHREGLFRLSDPVGDVTLWIDDRLAFRRPSDSRLTAVMTGDNPSASLEARAALAGGKVLHELRIGMKRDEREFFVTLKGPSLHFQATKLPPVVEKGEEEPIHSRLYFYDELALIVGALFQHFGELRTSEEWSDVVPLIQAWVAGEQ